MSSIARPLPGHATQAPAQRRRAHPQTRGPGSQGAARGLQACCREPPAPPGPPRLRSDPGDRGASQVPAAVRPRHARPPRACARAATPARCRASIAGSRRPLRSGAWPSGTPGHPRPLCRRRDPARTRGRVLGPNPPVGRSEVAVATAPPRTALPTTGALGTGALHSQQQAAHCRRPSPAPAPPVVKSSCSQAGTFWSWSQAAVAAAPAQSTGWHGVWWPANAGWSGRSRQHLRVCSRILTFCAGSRRSSREDHTQRSLAHVEDCK
mmetsp:Transcript_87021/g.246742  ORF Transcript_87021/g.246742 Transcript_87021/m.246742 type:complete len:266 (+) Transcript_87021:235-1032(+)